MKRLKLTKIITSSLIISSALLLNPISAHAEWKKDSKGWWYASKNSWYTGWKLIDGNWYYFYSNGYMAHDTTIDGYYLSSGGAWTDSTNTSLREQILENISIENPTFKIEYSSNDRDLKNVENIINNEIDKLKISNPYEMLNVSNYTLDILSDGSGYIHITISCTYKMTADMAAELDTKAREIVSNIAPDSMSQSDKELAIHDWIVNNTEYDQTFTIYDPYNTLLKHTGVCEGYSMLAQKMFSLAGIKSTIVQGTADGQAHAWNMVYIDGKWRHVDCTWDDPVSFEDILSHKYYNLTDQEMEADHSWDTSLYPSAN
ncbi:MULTISPECIES: transglutaminase domain-containing protein [unclassified Clostridium]|uniref:transglutaminase domain-containing protein n=1 Tax=unclassified Clostridium TaxID=2614128 RepID=UPI0002986963|nr:MULTISPECIES: transglutaminase domain-containing protein [unclassified Clostridium]EKQ56798.1 MAG: Transglutaminase-like superfamily protein,putative cell wall binding protein [Clostridium sp. Maddingley MBC34-26]